MTENKEQRQYVKDSVELKKPEKCPKCGGTNITHCPGGSSLKAVPGIWWKCESCKHEW